MPSIALNDGVFQITDDGDILNLVTNLRRESPWSPGRDDEVLGVRADGDDYLILIATTRRDVTSYSEVTVSADGLVDRRATDLTLADVGDVQGDYSFITGRAPNINMDEVVVENIATPGNIVLYTQQGRFSIRDDDDAEGTGERLTDSRGDEWELPRDTDVIGARDIDGGFALLLQTTDSRGRTSFSELEFSASGVAARRATSLTEAEKIRLLADEYDATPSGDVAQGVLRELDSPDGLDVGVVTFTQSGQTQFVIVNTADNVTVLATLTDSRGADWAPGGRETLVAVRENGDGFSVLLRNDSGRITEQVFSAEGVAAGSTTTFREYDLVQQSILYDSDLTGQGFDADNVDTVAAVLTTPDSVRADAGQVWVVRSEGGAFFVQRGETAPVEGAEVDRLLPNGFNTPTVPLLIADRNGAWSPNGDVAQGATPIGAREVSEDRFAVISVREAASGRKTFTEQVIDANTGQTIGRERTVDPVELEGLYLQDFNGDGVIDIRGAEYVTPLETLALEDDMVLRANFEQIDGVTITGGGEARIELLEVSVSADVSQFDLPYVFAERGVYVVDADETTVFRTYADLSEPPINVRPGGNPPNPDYIDPEELDGTFWYVGVGEYAEGNASSTSFQVNIRSTSSGTPEGYSDVTFRGANYLFEGFSDDRGPESVLLTSFTGRTYGAGEQQALPLNVEGFRFQGSATFENGEFTRNDAPVAALSGLGIGSVVANNVFANHRSAYNSGASDTEFLGNLVIESNRGVVFGGKADGSAVGGRIADNVFEDVGGGISVARKGVVIENNVVSATNIISDGTEQAGVGISLSQRNDAGVQFWLEDTKVLNNDLSGSSIGIAIQRGTQSTPVGGSDDFEVAGNSFGATPILNLTSDTFEFGANTVLGVAYDRMVVGGTGDDSIEASSDDDVLIGGAGADTFVFNSPQDGIGNNVITDFEGAGEQGGDVIDVSGLGVTSRDALNIAVQDGNTEISGEFAGTITLLGVTATLIDEYFLFAVN